MRVTHRSCGEFELFAWIIFGFADDPAGVQKCISIRISGSQEQWSGAIGDIGELRAEHALWNSPFLAIESLV